MKFLINILKVMLIDNNHLNIIFGRSNQKMKKTIDVLWIIGIITTSLMLVLGVLILIFNLSLQSIYVLRFFFKFIDEISESYPITYNLTTNQMIAISIISESSIALILAIIGRLLRLNENRIASHVLVIIAGAYSDNPLFIVSAILGFIDYHKNN